jgi:hypothetical protein
MGAVDTATPPTKSHARGGRMANVVPPPPPAGQCAIGVGNTTPPAPQNVVPTPPPAGQRAIGVGNTTPPAPHNHSGRNIGVEDSSPPSPAVQDCSGRARICANRWAMRHAGNGTQGATPPVPNTTLTHGDTGFCSPLPDFTQEMTALPSSPSLLSHDKVEAPRTPTPPLDHAVNDEGDEAVGGPHDGASEGFRIVVGHGG